MCMAGPRCAWAVRERALVTVTHVHPHTQQTFDNKWIYGMYIQNGRIRDEPGYPLRTGLREIVTFLQGGRGDVRLSANQNAYFGGISDADKPHFQALLDKYQISNERLSAMRLNSMACVALPTCGLALAESERYLPNLITLIEKVRSTHTHRLAITPSHTPSHTQMPPLMFACAAFGGQWTA
jgi:sulfite reductase beta subunit-like hemoprotein